MRSRSIRTVCIAVLAAVTMAASSSAWADWETKKLRALLSASETKGNSDTNWTMKWNLTGGWETPQWGKKLTLNLDSDYSKSETAKLDRLRAGFRLLDSDYGKVLRKWYPVYLLQTEGDHGLESVHTLFAGGYRQQRKYGFLECTLGASKDIQTSESWVGDLGIEFGFERKLGPKLKFSTGPKGEYGALGSVRYRDDRFRYSWNASLDYQASERLGIGYRLWYGNTVPNSDRTQWVGITYKLK